MAIGATNYIFAAGSGIYALTKAILGTGLSGARVAYQATASGVSGGTFTPTLSTGTDMCAKWINWVTPKVGSFFSAGASGTKTLFEGIGKGLVAGNFAGKGIPAAFHGLSGAGAGFLGLCGVGGAFGLLLGIKSLIPAVKHFTDTVNGVSAEVIKNPLFYGAEIAAALGVVASGAMLMLGGGVGAIPLFLGAAAVQAVCSVIDWGNSYNHNPLKHGLLPWYLLPLKPILWLFSTGGVAHRGDQ